MADPMGGCSPKNLDLSVLQQTEMWKFCVDECLASTEVFRERLLELPDDRGLNLGILVETVSHPNHRTFGLVPATL